MFPTADHVFAKREGRAADDIAHELEPDAIEAAGDLYAREELAERRQRTEAAIRRAEADA